MDTDFSCRIGKASGTCLFPDCLQDFEITPSYLSEQSRLLIVPEFAILCCTAAKRGPCQKCRKKKTDIFHQWWLRRILELGDNIRLLTKNFWDVLVSPLCTPLSASAGFADLVMLWEWVTSAYQRIFCTVNWLLANITSVDHDYDTKTFANATWRV